MERILSIVFKMVKILGAIAAVSLTVMMCLTVADVFGRAVGHPILGTYEVVGLLGVIVIGFAVPYTSWNKRHVYMDFLLGKLPRRKKDVLNIGTRIFGIVLFAFIGANLFHVGAEFSKAREVSMSLNIPLYPAAYAAGICCFVECVVFMCDIVKIREGKYE